MLDFKNMAVNIHIPAHQNDEDFEEAIAKQMFRLERDGQIVLTMRSKITAGEIIEDKIFENINDAEILVLLVSTAFLK